MCYTQLNCVVIAFQRGWMMKIITTSKLISCCLLAPLFVLLSACSLNPDFETYEGKSLTIGVIGEPPEIKEKQVSFDNISFDDVMNNDFDSYDAIFIMPENLSQASEKQYSGIYLVSTVPFFFIGANNHIPFTEEELSFDDDSWESWEWTPGESYASGVYYSPTEDSLSSWGFGLYDDKKTDNTIKEMYSRLFEVIEEI